MCIIYILARLIKTNLPTDVNFIFQLVRFFGISSQQTLNLFVYKFLSFFLKKNGDNEV
jgi:hypothetical protein